MFSCLKPLTRQAFENKKESLLNIILNCFVVGNDYICFVNRIP